MYIGVVEAYQVPYFECVSVDPSFDEMREVVCVGQRRPHIPTQWAADEVSILQSRGTVQQVFTV